MLRLSDLHSYYGAAHVLQGVSLEVGRGEIVGLLGRNGMGKTTTIRSIMNLRAPEVRAGEVSYNDRRLNGLPPHEIAQARIALVPQGRRLFASLTVTEHLTMLKPASARHGWTVARAFETFPRLAERRRHRASQLSGGERQMLAVARALMLDPEIVLMDEPSEGLAPVMVQHLESVIARLRGDGLGILLVEQNLSSALALCNRIYLIETGRIVHHDSAVALQAQPDILERYLGIHDSLSDAG
jgi:branched-chain amino acid transport system ATP-binding protein